MAVGNSDGDLAMLQFTDDKKGPALMVLVHHDDPDREYDYDRGTEKALKVAQDYNKVGVKVDRLLTVVFELSKKWLHEYTAGKTSVESSATTSTK